MTEPLFIDTHTHIYEPEFDADRADVVTRALEAGVGRMLLPAIDGDSYERMFAACREWSGCCFAMMGLHPTSVNDNDHWESDLQRVEELLKNPPALRFYGVGEIGLDYYWSRDFADRQREVFERQLELSLEFGLPVAVHTRDAWDDTVEIVRRFAGRGLRGVFHAFSGSAENVRDLLACGDFLFGIGGTVTFKKSSVAEVVAGLDLDRIVLETDSPYLTPVPFRGSRNEPAYIPYICNRIAELKGVTALEVAAATTAAAEGMFFSGN